ncbi:MAG: cobalamin biosynthesis protein CobG [Rhodobacteraceae bacterium]|nr:cobalamin biosynthesis protein CobG [Paracoccaceae bacterium]
MSAPRVKGWCPGAHRPMPSGDGLVVRIRPRLARLSAAQALGLCALAQEFGSGVIDLTNRANLQIRGVEAARHDALLQGLAGLDLLDVDPALETRRNLLVTPFWQPGDVTQRLAEAVQSILPALPDMPAKVGFAIDTGPAPLLQDAPADFRLERAEDGLILRADGVPLGRPVTEASAMGALHEMAAWFVARQTPDHRRMTHVTAKLTLPPDWTRTAPRPAAPRPRAGTHPLGPLLGAAFGQLDAGALEQAIRRSGTDGLRLTPWRLFQLEGVAAVEDLPFVTDPHDPALRIHACAGAPFCPQATVDTRALARALGPRLSGQLHVSGCAKGCALPRAADVTLVGREGGFDLVTRGAAWDTPRKRGLSPSQLMDGTGLI